MVHASELTNAAYFELGARKNWTLSRIAALINAGREGKWIDGSDQYKVADGTALLDDCARRIGTAATPMAALAAALRLSTAELDLLWSLACIELDPRLSRAVEPLLAPNMANLSVQMVELLVDAPTSIDFEKARRFGLVEIANAVHTPISRRGIRVTDRVLDLARGYLQIDRGLREIAEVYSLDSSVDESLRQEVPASFIHGIAASTASVIVAVGAEGSGRRTALVKAAREAGRAVISIDTRNLETEESRLSSQLRALARECALFGALPLLTSLDDDGGRIRVIERDLIDVVDGPVLVTAREPTEWRHARPVITERLAMPCERDRADGWRQALPDASSDLVDECARRYTLTLGVMQQVARAAIASAGASVSTATVHAAVRGQLDRRLAGLATRVETRQTWSDLVLPIDQFELLLEMCARTKFRSRVLDDWGFADKVGRGTGTAALLSGPPGTGKTMIAGLVARELGLDLYQVDLSKIVSKYIGETEKQLANLFDAAESGHAVLLFDEADSMFTKRTAVKSSNDRYANLEVNFLLQRMEAFTGITILTTNHESAIDAAFMRRLAMHVRVPMPDLAQREQLWRAMIPSGAATDGELTFAALAEQFVMSGGYIKNAVLRSAYLAAAADTPITNHLLWRAARAEYEAMGKLSVVGMAS